MDTQNTTARPRAKMSGLVRAAWLLVLAMMLTAAAWSISDQLIRWGMSKSLAYGLSLMFDAAGLICAEYARRAVERGISAGLPRLSILAFAGISGVLNYHHGVLIGGPVAGVAFASTSFLVELLFELHRRDVRDAELVERGLVPEMLPKIPPIAWLMYPRRSFTTLRAAVGARLDVIDPVQVSVERADRPSGQPDRHERTVRSAIRAAIDTMPGASADDIVQQLAILGIDTDADTVRTQSGPPDSSSSAVLALAPHDPDETITDTVRRVVRTVGHDADKVLAAVRRVHGPHVRRDTVSRLVKRVG